MIKKSWLRWFGHVEHKDDTDWVKRCMTMKIEGIRKRGRQKKIRWDSIYDDVESWGLSHKDVQLKDMEKMNQGATG